MQGNPVRRGVAGRVRGLLCVTAYWYFFEMAEDAKQIAVVEIDALFFTRRLGPASAEETRALLEKVAGALDQHARVGMVWHAPRAAGRPDAATRATIVDWTKTYAHILPRLRLDFAFASTLSRGVLTAINWLQKPPYEYAIHSDCLPAVEMACKFVGYPQPKAALNALDEEVSRLANDGADAAVG